MRYLSLRIILTLILIISPLTSNSQTFNKKYKDWSVYTTTMNGTKLCYIVSYPTKESGNYKRRGKPHVMVTSISGKKQEVSATSGYRYKKNTEPRLLIDGTEHKLGLVEDEISWFKSDKYDKKVINRMKKGYKMRVKGTSSKGTYSIDYYSLKGFTNAYNKMLYLCR